MRLSYTCRACKKQNILSIKEATRPELQRRMNADEVKVNCNHCGKQDKRHINRITAIPDNRVILFVVVLGIIATVILMVYFGL